MLCAIKRKQLELRV